MQTSEYPYLSKIRNILLITVLGTCILYFAKSLLVPMVFGLVLAMLLIPLSKKLEAKGMNRALAAVICILLMVLAFALIIGLLSWQMSNLVSDMGQIKQRLSEISSQVQDFVASHLGIAEAKQKEIVKKANTGNSITILARVTGNLLGILVNIILVLVYVFLFMYFRRHLMDFVLKASPDNQRQNISKLVPEASQVSQQYLGGLALMIVTLWVMYGIGFSLVGVHYAIFFALLCGTLEIIPFIGNITGTTLTVLMGLIQGGDTKLILGILITYGLVQFIQSYILQPLIVGKEVNLNPFFTIVSILIGDAIWEVPGMILAVPIFGMIKITCDHFDSLKPYGFLLGGDEKQDEPSGIFNRIKQMFK
ncbi:AI-2E family transporter [Mucilaginibacter robiniae]|uniref:AI-2E family transporter n=1 Tax=Mucilaginibacter robiniae TaxID=2728022 RepID=A0A7L5E3H5_9SPHI|nr:AI-2E family transporter [Mucilaginibacter robiniae]QJD97912.1 AI-2E family transporter [Mucilaginibacter robiniae]